MILPNSNVLVHVVVSAFVENVLLQVIVLTEISVPTKNSLFVVTKNLLQSQNRAQPQINVPMLSVTRIFKLEMDTEDVHSLLLTALDSQMDVLNTTVLKALEHVPLLITQPVHQSHVFGEIGEHGKHVTSVAEMEHKFKEEL